ncbi:MAG: TerL [Myxococcota bacterium]
MSATITLGAPDYPVLNAWLRSRARCSFIMGPLGSGKTIAACQKILALMTEQEPNAQGVRPTRWLAIRNTYPDLMGTTVKDFVSVFDGLGKMRYGGLEPPTFRVHFEMPDGTRVKSEMIFLALDRDDAVRKLRGYQTTGTWLNEGKELVKSVVDMADLRHGRYPSMVDGGIKPTWHGMLGDTNAPDEDHWYYKLAEERRPQGWEFFRQPGGVVKHDGAWVKNPDAENVENLPAGYYVQGLEGKDPDWIRVMLSNEYGFVVEGKPVHPEYVDSVHCATEPIEVDRNYPLIIGIDFGRTPAAAITQNLEHIGRRVVLDELTSEDMSAAIFGPELKRYLDTNFTGLPVQVWCDPSGGAQSQATEDTPIRILRAAGIPAQPCSSNNPDLRRASISNPATRVCMDGKPAFLVSPKARMIRKGLMGGFAYRRMKVAGSERFTDLPDKNAYSHPVEALEYALMGSGEGRDALRRATPIHRRDEFVQTEAMM